MPLVVVHCLSHLRFLVLCGYVVVSEMSSSLDWRFFLYSVLSISDCMVHIIGLVGNTIQDHPLYYHWPKRIITIDIR